MNGTGGIGATGATGATGAAGANGADGAPGANGEVTDEALQSGRHLLGVDAGGDDAYAVTLSPAPTSYDADGTCIDGEICDGEMMHLRVSTANTGAAAIVVNGLTSKNIVMPDGTTLTDGMIRSTAVNIIMYNRTGDYWQIAGGAGSSSGATTFSGLTDCAATRTSASRITISGCKVTVPNKSGTTLSSATIDTVSGDGSIFVYVNATPALRVVTSSALDVTCTGCTVDGEGTHTDYPANVGRVVTWAATAAVWAGSGTVTINSGVQVPEQLAAGVGIKPASLLPVAGVRTIEVEETEVMLKSAAQTRQEVLCTGSASTTATCSLTPTLLTYTSGMMINFLAGATNTTTYTLNINGLGAKSILTSAAGALSAGDITSGRYYMLTYDGTQFRLPASGSSVTTVSDPLWALGPIDLSATGATTNTFTANRIYVGRACTALARTVDTFVYYSSNSSHDMNAALYTTDGATKIFELGVQTAVLGAGQKTPAIGAGTQTIAPGCYLIAFVTSSATVQLGSWTINGGMLSIMQNSSTAAGRIYAGYQDSWGGTTMPSSLTLTTITGNTPWPMFGWMD